MVREILDVENGTVFSLPNATQLLVVTILNFKNVFWKKIKCNSPKSIITHFQNF